MAVWRTSERTSGTISRGERILAACMPSVADVLFACVLLAVVFGLQGRAIGNDGDAGWSLRIGLQTLAHGLPRSEFLLSTTYGHPMVYWEWLSQVAYAGAWKLGGLNGVVTLAGGIVALTSVGLFAALRRRGLSLAPALALALAGTALTSITWTARAQLFSLPLTLWWSEWLWRYWRQGHGRRLLAFPLVMALWANLHGGFIGGLILLATATGVAWLFPRHRAKANPWHLTLALLGSLAATLTTPWGPALLAHIMGYLRNPLVTRYTQEYQSPDFHTSGGLLFLGLVAALVVVWIRAARQAYAGANEAGRASGAADPLAASMVAIWTLMAFTSVRFVPLWVLICLPVLGELLAERALGGVASTEAAVREDVHSGRRLWRGVTTWLSHSASRLEATDQLVGKGVWSAIAVLWVMLTIAHGGVLPGTSVRALNAQFDPQVFPVQAAMRLHAAGLPPGRGFNTFEWGGYLDYALPEYHAFIDSRSDAYSQALLSDYATMVELGPGWQHLLDRYEIRWALLPAGSSLAQMLALSPGWRCAPADDQGVAALCVRGKEP